MRITVDAHDYCNKVSETDIHPFRMLDPNIHKGLTVSAVKGGWSIIRKLFWFFFITGFLIFALGCDENDPDDPKLPLDLEVTDTSIREGDTIVANMAITVNFNNEMVSADISVSGASGNTVLQGKTAIWTPIPEMPAGSHELTVTGTDIFGQELVEIGLITFFALAHE